AAAVNGGLRLRSGIRWCHEAVAESHHGLDEARLSRGVAERLADLADGAVDTVVRIQVGAFLSPDALHDLLAADELARLLGKQQKDLHGNPLELLRASGPAQLPCRGIELDLTAESEN